MPIDAIGHLVSLSLEQRYEVTCVMPSYIFIM